MGNPVAWFEIYVNDMDRAKSFYQTVLDIQITHLPTPGESEGMEMHAFPMNNGAPGASGALVKMADMPAGGNSTLVYFDSQDCSIEESRVNEAGGMVLQSKMSIGEYGFVSICRDTEGNMFGLYSMA